MMRKQNNLSSIIGRESIDLTTWMVNGHKPSYMIVYGIRIMKPAMEEYDVISGNTREKKKELFCADKVHCLFTRV